MSEVIFIHRSEPMNIHHLELFYYVARHGGISRALAHIPYGIQQPAVSAQLIRLEEELGVSLFRRRPFMLTPAGDELYAFSRPFYERLGDVEESIRHGSRNLRIAAAESVLGNHLPGPLKMMKEDYPDLYISLREVGNDSLNMLANGELDIVIGRETAAAPKGVSMERLIETRLVLLAPESAGRGAVAAFLKRNAGSMPLIALPSNSGVCRIFNDELARRGIRWPASLELGGLDLIQRYVEQGFGVGLMVEGSVSEVPAGFRVLALDQFPKLRIAAFHAGMPDDVTRQLLSRIRDGAKRLRTRKGGVRKSGGREL